MRLKDLGFLALGILVGAFALYYVLWRTDGLAPGHLLARTTADLGRGGARPPPLPTIPFPTPSPSPPPAEVSPTATPTPAGLAVPTPSGGGRARR